MASVVEIVTDLVTPILDELTFELVDIEYVKEGKIGFWECLLIKQGALISMSVLL